ncbi:VapE domain-containing protein [Nitrosomonas sp.]|uniref:VapE domain-containing protein n=1 Tax=Nitrosomonas sp. TaxID=42353 RepID=UPI0037CB3F09
MNNRIDFKRIADAALGRARALVPQWLPGGETTGAEYKCLNPTRSDHRKGSFSINLVTGIWFDFATGDGGGDLISLYAYIHHLSQLDAAKAVTEQLGMAPDLLSADPEKENKPPEKPARKRSAWVPILPVPADAPPVPVAHPVRGRSDSSWDYFDQEGRLLGAVHRFKTSDGGKEVLPCVFAQHESSGKREWRWIAFPEPRPLYGLREFARSPDKPVLLVEGEKCVDAGKVTLEDVFVSVSWPGGGKAVGKIDWSPLAGRVIYVWPDCDAERDKAGDLLPEHKQPGMSAMLKIRDLLLKLDPATKFHLVPTPAPDEKPSGWDIADAIDEGMEREALLTLIRSAREWHKEPERPLDKPDGPEMPAQQSAGGGGDGPPWSVRDLVWDGKKPAACLSNVYDILEHDRQWQGVIAYDEFSYRVVKLKPPPFVGGETGEWNGDDDVQTSMWITRKYGFAPRENMTALAVESLARFHQFNPVQDYLRSLQWDGIPRVDDWIADFINAPKSEYVWRVSRWFLVGMVARAMRPGIKFDYCLVLEGDQGRGKSSLLRVLGGEWFDDTDLDLHSKDSMSALRGKWLYEISELGSLARSEATKQKSFFSREVDEFRPVYGAREVRCPRQLVFCGTTNEWEWNKDQTGGRRFWPIECTGEINIDGLAAVRDQLFAEAYQIYMSGERFWPTNREQIDIFNPEQFRRSVSDSYLDMIESWIAEQYKEFCIADVATDCLKIDAARLSRDVQTRIGSALRKLGCRRIEKRTHAVTRYWYKASQEMGSGHKSGQDDVKGEDHGIDF